MANVHNNQMSVVIFGMNFSTVSADVQKLGVKYIFKMLTRTTRGCRQ